MIELGDTQEEYIEQYEPRQIQVTLHRDDVRTLIHLKELKLDDSGIIGHLLHCVRMDDV